jgi:hypothetical protein
LPPPRDFWVVISVIEVLLASISAAHNAAPTRNNQLVLKLDGEAHVTCVGEREENGCDWNKFQECGNSAKPSKNLASVNFLHSHPAWLKTSTSGHYKRE